MQADCLGTDPNDSRMTPLVKLKARAETLKFGSIAAVDEEHAWSFSHPTSRLSSNQSPSGRPLHNLTRFCSLDTTYDEDHEPGAHVDFPVVNTVCRLPGRADEFRADGVGKMVRLNC
jgi:hypothetical protein